MSHHIENNTAEAANPSWEVSASVRVSVPALSRPSNGGIR